MRNTIGWENKLMVDANQKWGVQQVGHSPARPSHNTGGNPGETGHVVITLFFQ